jgi:hypothetical protein
VAGRAGLSLRPAEADCFSEAPLPALACGCALPATIVAASNLEISIRSTSLVVGIGVAEDHATAL